MPLITLTTDFGTDSPYVAQMKGAILSLQPRATIVDITHSIPPQDIRHGAFVLNEVCFRFPPETIHVAVVDPGVGTERELVYAKIGGQQFLAPDNGLLGDAAASYAPERIFAITNRTLWAEQVSHTFHGRDILSPVAARLCSGTDPALLGLPREKLMKLDQPKVVLGEHQITGEVIAVDSFGNLITNIKADQFFTLQENAASLSVRFGSRKIDGVVRTYGERESGELVALLGSSGHLEVAMVQGNAAAVLGGRRGMPISVEW